MYPATLTSHATAYLPRRWKLASADDRRSATSSHLGSLAGLTRWPMNFRRTRNGAVQAVWDGDKRCGIMFCLSWVSRRCLASARPLVDQYASDVAGWDWTFGSGVSRF
ncbi:hypothetical protein IG631_08970 [Alternaria alternata]|nr:hypothetical protein IG631_08970 [Alternaria alternata]